MPFLVCFEREVAIVKTEKVGKDQGKRKKAEMGEIASTTRQRPLETAKAHKTSRFWPARKESKQALLASEEKIKGNNFMFRAGGCLESRVERSLTTKASKPNTTRGNSTPLQPRTPKPPQCTITALPTCPTAASTCLQIYRQPPLPHVTRLARPARRPGRLHATTEFECSHRGPSACHAALHSLQHSQRHYSDPIMRQSAHFSIVSTISRQLAVWVLGGFMLLHGLARKHVLPRSHQSRPRSVLRDFCLQNVTEHPPDVACRQTTLPLSCIISCHPDGNTSTVWDPSFVLLLFSLKGDTRPHISPHVSSRRS